VLGLRPNTLAQWRISGDGPAFVKLGRAVRYRRADIERWLEGQTRRSTSDHGATSAKLCLARRHSVHNSGHD
jgi:hypothetical protein